eukprot:6490354-Amphidinium_carterae.1
MLMGKGSSSETPRSARAGGLAPSLSPFSKVGARSARTEMRTFVSGSKLAKACMANPAWI